MILDTNTPVIFKLKTMLLNCLLSPEQLFKTTKHSFRTRSKLKVSVEDGKVGVATFTVKSLIEAHPEFRPSPRSENRYQDNFQKFQKLLEYQVFC